MTEQWTPKGIIEAVTYAYKVLDATESKPGHRSRHLKAAWPEYDLDFKRPMKGRVRPDSFEIERMEIILLGSQSDGVRRPGWLNGRLMNFPEIRAVLIAACYGAAFRYSARQVAEHIGLPEATFRWQRNRAAQILADELNTSRLLKW